MIPMLRLSITLPNNAQINLESEDEVVIDRILGIVLADISHALLSGLTATDASSGAALVREVTAPTPPAPVQPVVSVEPAAPQRLAAEESPAPAAAVPVSDAPEQPVAQQPEPAVDEINEATLEPASNPAQPPQPILSDWDVSLQEQPEEAWPQLEGAGNGIEASNGSGVVRNPHAGVSSVVPEVAERAFVDFCRAANPLGDMRRVVVAAEGANRYLAMDGVDAEALGRLFDTVGWPRAHNFVQTLRNAARSKFGWLERIPGRAGHYTVTDLGRSTALGR
jgi:hypothetical protein